MKTRDVSIPVMLGAAIVTLLCSCGRNPSNSAIVEFVSGQGIALANYSDYRKSGFDEDGRLALYLGEPTLFYLETDDDIEIMYLYLPEDGNRIELDMDGDILYANGIARSVFVDPDEPRNFAAWFESADETALKSLRHIHFEDASPGTPEADQLKTIMTVNPHIGFMDFAQSNLWKAGAGERMPLFSSAPFTTKNPDTIEFLQRMDFSETVFLMPQIGADDEELYLATIEFYASKKMPNLRRVSGWGVNELIGAFPHANAWTLNIEGMEESPSLEGLHHLKELHILDEVSIPIDLGQLPRPEKLRALTINVATNVTGLEQLVNLEFLNPGEAKLSTADLAALLEHYPDLVFLDLSQAEVESLEPLRNHRTLEVVALGDFMTDEEPDFSPLSDLPKLRYVALTDDLHESGAAAAIREISPQTVIYHRDKFCLGSGWLLLFPPLLLIALLAKRMRTQTRRRV